MPQSLPERLTALRRRLKLVLWVYGASWVVAVLFGGTLLVGALDWALYKLGGRVNLEDPGLRLMLALSIVAGGAWAGWRFLVRPLRRRLSDVELALRVERRFPFMHDSLASTVQFDESGGDPRLGSPELQQRVVEETLRRVEHADLSEAVETRSVRRVAATAAAICLLVALVAGLNQALAATAIHRLFYPFAEAPWPRTTDLRLLDAEFRPIRHDPTDALRLPRGTTLRLYVENVKGLPPDDVALQYKLADEEVITRRLRTASLRDSDGRPREVAVVDLLIDKGPVRLRAVGGDHRNMPWHLLEVVPPPRLEKLQVTLTPPRYAGREIQRLPEGLGHVQALVGTRVEVEATVNKPLRHARLRIKDNPPRPLELSGGGRRFQASFELASPGTYSYWFDLTDRKGFSNPDAPRYDIRAEADRPPEVKITRPAENVYVTPTAVVPLSVLAEDDLQLVEVRFRYKIDGAETGRAVVHEWELRGEKKQKFDGEHRWDLATLPIVAGMEIEVFAEAVDNFDLGPQHERHVRLSTPRILTVVPPEEKAAELATRQRRLLDELEHVEKMQSRGRDQLGDLMIQLREAGRLRPGDDINLLKRIEQDQREITSRLAGPEAGVEARTRSLIEEMRDNRLDDAETAARLLRMADELGHLRRQHLPNIENRLTEARKSAEAGQFAADDNRQPAPDADEQRELMKAAGESQDVVLEALGELLRDLTRWRDRTDLAGDLKDLLSGQRDVNRESELVRSHTLGKSADELTDQERADLARLAEKQRRGAEDLDRFEKTLQKMADELSRSRPRQAGTLRDAAGHVRRRATAAQMRESARQLEDNDVGRAIDGQQRVMEDLSELEAILQDRGPGDDEALIKRIKEAESELEQLHKRQEELRQRLEQARKIPDPAERRQELLRLQKQQQQLQRDVEAMARRLRRLQTRRAAESAGRAAARMQRAGDQLGQGEDQAAAADQQQALDDLEQARRELAQARREAEERLARETLERIADELQGMLGRQQNVIDGTLRLQQELNERGAWSRGRLMSLEGLITEQRRLQEDTDALAEKVKAAEVFTLALRGGADFMRRAAERLAERTLDEQTVEIERSALRRLNELIESLKPEQGENAPQQPPQGGPAQAGPQTDGIPHLAQLKLLKTLQEDLIRRTAELDTIKKKRGPLAREQQEEFDRLALEQTRLADLARNLTRAAADALPRAKEPERKAQ